MRTVAKIVAVLVCAALVASPAVTQQKKGFGGGFGFGGGTMTAGMLLANEGVQKEIKLTEDQIAKIKEVSQKIRDKFAEDFQKLQDLDQQERREKGAQVFAKLNEETTKELGAVLKPEQDKRLKQILRQQLGIQALQDAEAQKSLKLTDEQKENLKLIAADFAKDSQELRQNAFAGGFSQEAFQEMQKKVEGLRKETLDKATALLNDSQKKELKELMGEPFKLEMRFGAGFGKKKQ